jgi:hypothetical protein
MVFVQRHIASSYIYSEIETKLWHDCCTPTCHVVAYKSSNMIIAHVLLSFNPPYIIPWRHFICVQIMNNSLNKARIRSIIIIIGNRALLVYKIVDFLAIISHLKKKKRLFWFPFLNIAMELNAESKIRLEEGRRRKWRTQEVSIGPLPHTTSDMGRNIVV